MLCLAVLVTDSTWIGSLVIFFFKKSQQQQLILALAVDYFKFFCLPGGTHFFVSSFLIHFPGGGAVTVWPFPLYLYQGSMLGWKRRNASTNVGKGTAKSRIRPAVNGKGRKGGRWLGSIPGERGKGLCQIHSFPSTRLSAVLLDLRNIKAVLKITLVISSFIWPA